MKNLTLRCKQCGRGKLKNRFDKCYECRQSTHKMTDLINLFSRKGLQNRFPTAKIIRHKTGWEVRFPLPKDFKRLNKFEAVIRE